MREKSLPVSLALVDSRLVFGSLALLSWAIPFSLAGPQLVVGTLVNSALFAAAVLLPQRYLLPLLVLPSLGVLSRGLIFGPLTSFLIFFLPFIWLGNGALVLVFKKASSLWGYAGSVLLASLVKGVFLFLFAQLFFQFNFVPQLFLKTMGLNQLITACLGGFLTLPFLKKLANGKTQS